MAKQTKASKSQPVSEVTKVKEEPPVAEEPVKEKKEKKEKKSKEDKKTKEATEATEEVTQPVEATPSQVVESSPEVSVIAVKMADMSARLQQLALLTGAIKAEYKSLEKLVARNEKVMQKLLKKKKKAVGTRQPSGITKPTLISDELAAFLGIEAGSKLAFTEVSKNINQYIMEHNLQNSENRRNIVPNEELTALFKLSPDDKVHYFNLHKYINQHFIKTPKE